MQVVLVYLQAFCRNSLLKSALQPKIAKDSLKSPFWGFKFIDVDKIKKPMTGTVLVMISNMSIHICNRFHTRRANRNKITSFKGDPSFTPLFAGNPFTQGHKILSQYTKVLGAANSKDFVILACTVLTQITSVTARWTDRCLDDG